MGRKNKRKRNQQNPKRKGWGTRDGIGITVPVFQDPRPFGWLSH